MLTFGDWIVVQPEEFELGLLGLAVETSEQDQ